MLTSKAQRSLRISTRIDLFSGQNLRLRGKAAGIWTPWVGDQSGRVADPSRVATRKVAAKKSRPQRQGLDNSKDRSGRSIRTGHGQAVTRPHRNQLKMCRLQRPG